MVDFGPVNNEKIKEASIQGRIVFHLPKSIRVNREQQIHDFHDLLSEVITVTSFVLLLGLFVYKVIFCKTAKKIDSESTVTVKSATSSSTSSFSIGINAK